MSYSYHYLIKPLLAENAFKDIIINSLQFLEKDGRIKL